MSDNVRLSLPLLLSFPDRNFQNAAPAFFYNYEERHQIAKRVTEEVQAKQVTPIGKQSATEVTEAG